MEGDLPEGFTDFSLPEPVRRRLRTSNLMENLNPPDPAPHPHRLHLSEHGVEKRR